MRTIRAKAKTSVAPGRVLAIASDFSKRRAEVFSAVRLDHMEVHELGETSADVTEGTPVGPFGVNWERCDYDWSQPGSVKAPVTDSNVYEPAGSGWEISARPAEGGGSEVEMIWIREFKGGVRGRSFGLLYRLAGKPLFGRYAREIVSKMEEVERTKSPG